MKDNFKTYKWILSRVRRFVPALAVISVIGIIVSYMGVKYSLVMRDVIDAAIGGTEDELKRAVIIMIVFIAVMLILKLLNRNITQVTGFKLNRMWKQQLMHEVINDDYQKVSKYHSGNLLSRMTSDVQAVDSGLISFVPGVLALFTKLITAIVVMGMLEPMLTAVICVGGVLVVLASNIFRKRLKELHKQVQEAGAKVTSFIQETLERLHMVQALDVAEEIEKREDDLLEKRYRIQLKRKNLGLVASSGLNLICIAAELGVLIFSVIQLRAGLITFGTLAAMVTLFAKLESPFVSLSGVLPQYIAMMGSAERIREICELGSEGAHSRDAEGSLDHKADDAGKAAGSSNDGHKTVREDKDADSSKPDSCRSLDAAGVYDSMTAILGHNIWFKYDDAAENEYVIKALDFMISKGAFCAVVGSSGIGKSTLMKLMLGLCVPEQGEICCSIKADGIYGVLPVSRDTRSLFAYVPQGNMLLSGSLKDNLALTKPDASDEEIAKAIYVADMEDFVAELPDGLDTVIGENALGISEGQAQRVSIARAVLSGKPVILLDEATSALDAQTEKRVLERIHALHGKTVIAVTHRPAAREISDCVIEL